MVSGLRELCQGPFASRSSTSSPTGHPVASWRRLLRDHPARPPLAPTQAGNALLCDIVDPSGRPAGTAGRHGWTEATRAMRSGAPVEGRSPSGVRDGTTLLSVAG